jgi:hypothetical protein
MRIILPITFILFFISIHSYSQFTIQGLKINGTSAGEESGFSQAITGDGSTVVIGAPLSANGQVRVFEYILGSWTQKGSTILGEASGDEMGYSVAISADGNIFVSGAIHNDDGGVSAGSVRAYMWDGIDWAQLGNDIDGIGSGDLFGNAVSLSDDGYTLAIGARENNDNGNNAGHSRIFEWNGTSWIQKGSTIMGEAAADFSGYALSLSDDGNTLAIGAINNDGNGANSGHTRVFLWNGSSWVQKGNDIDGEDAGELSGCSIALSTNGDVIVIGSRSSDDGFSDAGKTRVFTWNGSAWVQKGSNIIGEAAGDFSGYAVDINNVGDVIAIGAPDNDGTGTDRGHVRVYYFYSGTWYLAYNQDINGQANNDFFGGSVRLNDSGSIVSIGARRQGGTNAGAVYIYNTSNSISACGTPATTETLTSQTDVNNFFTTLYVGCTDFIGNLGIRDDNDGLDNITDLSPLLQLVTLGGNVVIDGNQNLSSLNGLGNLNSVGKDLTIISNPQITSLSGLNELSTVGSDLQIENNINLTNLMGLESLNNTGKNLVIDGNSSLITLEHLNSLDSVGSTLNISNNNALLNLDQFNSLKYIGSNLTINTGNSALETISGFNTLVIVEGNLTIRNVNITSISGFQNIDSINGRLRIIVNSNLQSITGFNNLTFVANDLGIFDNPTLITVTGFSSLTGHNNVLNISSNNSLTTISGFNNIKSIYELRLIDNIMLNDASGFINYDTCKSVMTIENNGFLDLDDFINLKSVAFDLNIIDNTKLERIDSLKNLNAIGQYFIINNNDMLIQLNGLQGITSLPNGSLTIDGNAILENVDSLSNIAFIQQNLTVTNNPNLNICCGLFTVIDAGAVGGLVTISNNGTNCDDPADIQNGSSCLPPCSIALTSAVGTDNQTLSCLSNIQNITYEVGGVLDGTVTGLPNGLTYSFGDGLVEISGSATQTGTFNFTVIPNSPCNLETSTGTLDLDGGVVKIGTTCYPDLESATLAVLPNEVIDIFGTITPSATIFIPPLVTIRINSNGTWVNTTMIRNNGIIQLNGGIFENGVSGVYKGHGSFVGNFINNGVFSPGD